MGLRAQMKNLSKVCMVNVRKNSQELAVYVLNCGGERCGEFLACSVSRFLSY
jgi:hypothetical protein